VITVTNFPELWDIRTRTALAAEAEKRVVVTKPPDSMLAIRARMALSWLELIDNDTSARTSAKCVREAKAYLRGDYDAKILDSVSKSGR
jgi:hypothetical protein